MLAQKSSKVNMNRDEYIKIYDTANKMVPKNADVLFLGLRGSILHGTHAPDSDIDVIGCYVYCDMTEYLGIGPHRMRESFDKMIPATEHTRAIDIVLYELRKFLNMLAKGNPNVLESIFVDNDIILQNSIQTSMDVIKRAVVSKKIYSAYRGFSMSERKYLYDPSGYGAKHKQLYKKCGYNVKHAINIIRMNHVLLHFLETGKVNPIPPLAVKEEWLLPMRNGLVGVETVADEISRLEELIASTGIDPRIIPNQPDYDAISDECLFIIESHSIQERIDYD